MSGPRPRFSVGPVPFEVVDEGSILDRAWGLVRGAERAIWLTSPWIVHRSANMLLRDALPKVARGDLDVRIVYRVKEPTDLEITDLESLKALEDAGCKIRYSTRLHAKLVLCDGQVGIVSSSNLTPTAGYSPGGTAPWKNEEVGILVREEPDALADLRAEFERIWDAASMITEDTLGISMDYPKVGSYSFVGIRELRSGAYVTADDGRGTLVIGRIAEITSYNRSFPRMGESVWMTQGYDAAPTAEGDGGVPSLSELFSHPEKEQGFLVAKTYFEPESVFSVAKVEVLKHYRDGRLVAPTHPLAPGSDVHRASEELLHRLLGSGEVRLGAVQHHPEVDVLLRADEMLSKHTAVLGMTGSGKSNAIKVLLGELRRARPDLRVVIVDTHGEYVSADTRALDVELRRCIQNEEVVKELTRASRSQKLLWAIEDLAARADSLEDFLSGAEADPELERLAGAARERDDLCLRYAECATVVDDSGSPVDMTSPGLYVLDLRRTDSMVERAEKAGEVMRQVFEETKASDDAAPALVVIDEAQNFAPEQQTGWLSMLREASFDDMFRIATEGRKFGVGLLVSTQRPARVSKDILSQCNTHIIFRVANLEDLQAIAGSFEAATKPLLESLPGFDTGVCVVGGTAIEMVVGAEVPLFEGDLRVDGGLVARAKAAD